MDHVLHLKVVHQILKDAGITASVKRVEGADPFIRFILFGTHESVGRWMDRAVIEIESWASSPMKAMEQLTVAKAALDDAVLHNPNVREIRYDELMRELPTGEDGWERYIMRIYMRTRNTANG